jgi:hypothetical protein
MTTPAYRDALRAATPDTGPACLRLGGCLGDDTCDYCGDPMPEPVLHKLWGALERWRLRTTTTPRARVADPDALPGRENGAAPTRTFQRPNRGLTHPLASPRQEG